MYIGRYYYIYSHKYRAYYIGTSYTRLICFVLLGQGMITYLAFGLRDDFYQLVVKKAYILPNNSILLSNMSCQKMNL